MKRTKKQGQCIKRCPFWIKEIDRFVKTSTKAIMDYSGMTVNERLVVSGLITDFDIAIKNKDKGKLLEILKK